MKSYKITIVFTLFLLFTMIGVFLVSVSFSRGNKLPIDPAIYSGDLYSHPWWDGNDILYTELNILNRSENNLKILINKKDLDFRLAFGSHILYINEEAVIAVKNSIVNIVDKIVSR